MRVRYLKQRPQSLIYDGSCLWVISGIDSYLQGSLFGPQLFHISERVQGNPRRPHLILASHNFEI